MGTVAPIRVTPQEYQYLRTLGQALTQARKAQQYSQDACAAKAWGVGTERLRRYQKLERGSLSGVALLEVTRAAALLEVPLAEVLLPAASPPLTVMPSHLLTKTVTHALLQRFAQITYPQQRRVVEFCATLTHDA